MAAATEAFVFRGAALTYVINSRWLREQHLVAHNAAFEIAFLRQHSTPPSGAKAQHPVECTMQAAGLLYGCWNRSLADSQPERARHRAAEGAADELLVRTEAEPRPDRLCRRRRGSGTPACGRQMRPALEAKGRLAAYELQRNAIPAVADMQLRGLGLRPGRARPAG